MKFCPNCGMQCETSDRFCNNCGNIFPDAESQQPAYQAPEVSQMPDKSTKKKKSVGVIIAIITVVVLVLAGGVLLVLDATEIIDFIDVIKAEDKEKENDKPKDMISGDFEKDTEDESSSEETDTESEKESSFEEPETEFNEMSDYDYILEKGCFTVGYTLFAPIAYEENDKLIGFETEFAEAVAKELGLEVEFVQIDWSKKEDNLNAKDIDCIWNAMTVTEERKDTMELSHSYMEDRQILVVKKENAEKYADIDVLPAGTKVVTEKMSAGENVVSEDSFFSDAEYTVVDNYTSVLNNVKSGTSDCAVVDYVLSINDIIVEDDLVIVEGISFQKEEYAIGFRKGSDFCDRVNECIEKLVDDGTLEEIAEKYNLDGVLLK